MAYIHDISFFDFVVPLSALVQTTGSTSRSSQLYLSVTNPEPQESSILTTNSGLIKSPRRVNKNAWREFRTQLHELVPQLKNMTHEEIESLVDERHQEFLDSDNTS
jgi:hypothetical protein